MKTPTNPYAGFRYPAEIISHAVWLYHRFTFSFREVEEIKTVPYVPLSHPFVERWIGTVRREFLDHTLFWNATDLQRKLDRFQTYYNEQRVHASLNGDMPAQISEEAIGMRADLNHFRWQQHCCGLYQLPVAV